jgi:hypothetical protein
MSAGVIALGDESVELVLQQSLGHQTPRCSTPSSSSSVGPQPAQNADAEAPADQKAGAAGVRISSILTPTPHSMSENLYRTNVVPTVSASCTIGEVMLVFLALEWISGSLDLHKPSLYAFVGGVGMLVIFRVLRESDEVYVESFKVTFPVSVITSCCMLWLAEDNDTGVFTMPLITLMLATQNASRWVLEPQPRPNLLKHYLRCFPISIVLTILMFLPQFAVAVPGRLLAKHPIAYTLWTGVGYPILSFLMRKVGLSYFVNMAGKKVEVGELPTKDVVPWVSAISLCISTTLMFGNIMLLFLADDVGYALLGSVASIFVEVGGKIYVIWSTEKSMKMYLGARGITRVVLRAQAEPGVNEAATMRSNGNCSPDERLREEYWEDIRAMMALRWTNEIVSEKCCIMVGAFVTKVLIDSPRTTEEQIVVTMTFLATEFIADALLVYCLDKWFAVPFRRMPLAGKLSSPEFWNEVKLTAVVIGTASFLFKHAFETAEEWFPDAVDAVPFALGGNATSIALNATMP